MKTLDRLAAIREKNTKEDKTRILVGMATCGISAGAKPVMAALNNEIKKRGIDNVYVTQTGCVGVCRLEPIVEVVSPGGEKVSYVKMTPEKAAKVIVDHIVNRNIVTEYTIGAADKVS